MANNEIRIGEQYRINDILYTVIGFKNDIIIFVQTESSSIEFLFMKSNAFYEEMNEKQIFKNEVEEKHVDINLLSAYKKEEYLKNLAFINDINDSFGPYYYEIKSYKHDPSVEKIRIVHNIKKTKAWYLIRKYLQSGLNHFSLIPKQGTTSTTKRKVKNKLGRKSKDTITPGVPLTEEVIKHFDEGISFFKSNRASSINDAYHYIIAKHYYMPITNGKFLSWQQFPANQSPTYKQFYNYLTGHVEKDEIEKAKTSSREQRNNSRLLLSDNLININGPCSLVEVDECELDVFLVSREDPNVVIGRPVVYVMIDIFTRLIMGVSVSLENNSFRGITNCMLSLIEDKNAICESYGIETLYDEWPDHRIPNRIRCDYGSEYISTQFERICSELNIQREIVAPGTGSLKGQVEQVFHQIHSGQNADLNKKGLIEKRYDSTHKTDACLNIDEIKKIVYSAVVKHNNNYMENYPLTRDMRKNNVIPIPYELWKYGVKKYGEPKSINNDNSYKYTLLEEIKATVSRDGVTYKGLKYIQENDEHLLNLMVKAGKKRLPFICRIDSRDISNIYYLYDGRIKTLHLNYAKVGMFDYTGLTLVEYEKILANKKMNDKAGKNYNQYLTIQQKSFQQELIKEAKKKSSGIPDSKNLRENRAKEKKIVAQDELIMKPDKTKELEAPLINETSNGKINDTTFEDVLASLQELEDEMYGR